MNILERFFSSAKRVGLRRPERESVRSFLEKATTELVRTKAQDGLQGVMDVPPTLFLAAARSVRANRDDLSRVRSTLAAYTISYLPQRMRSFLLLKRSLAAVGATLVFGSTVCVAAESAVPGDVLYPVKTAVNEPVLEAMASLTPATRAQWKVTQVNRRLQEMGHLSDREELTPEHEEKLTRKIEERMQQALTQIDALEETDQAGSTAEIRDSLGQTLRKNEKLLKKLEQTRPALRPQVRQYLRRTEEKEISDSSHASKRGEENRPEKPNQPEEMHEKAQEKNAK
ncbi:MAG: hypothetical protein WCS85_01175 [Candidatus Peribacteraceae bacterium]|jgi:flagellar basal body-associated protein FliL